MIDSNVSPCCDVTWYRAQDSSTLKYDTVTLFIQNRLRLRSLPRKLSETGIGTPTPNAPTSINDNAQVICRMRFHVTDEHPTVVAN